MDYVVMVVTTEYTAKQSYHSPEKCGPLKARITFTQSLSTHITDKREQSQVPDAESCRFGSY